nr:hypothetical protein CFP56_46131 [Quercus suber]
MLTSIGYKTYTRLDVGLFSALNWKHHRQSNSTWAPSLGVVSEIFESADHVEYSASKIVKDNKFWEL